MTQEQSKVESQQEGQATNPDLASLAPSSEISEISPRRSFVKRLLQNGLLVTVSLLLTLFITELGFRAVSAISKPTKEEAKDIARLHRRYDRPRFFLLPESSRDNRDYPYPPEKAPGTFRIVVVGDSFTYGGKVPFDDTFAKRLERILKLNSNHRPVEVLNWGVPGLSTRQEVLGVRHALTNFSPDLIILQVTLNDPELKPYDGHLEVHPKWLDRLDYWWKSGSFVLQRIVNAINQRQYINYYFSLFEDSDTLKNFRIGASEISKFTKKANVPTFAVTFPIFSHRIDKSYPFHPLHEKVASVFTEAELMSLDLRSWYNGFSAERLSAVPGADPHPNEIAHRIAAEAIYDFIEHHKLVPEDLIVKNIRSHRPLKGRYPAGKEADKEKNEEISGGGKSVSEADTAGEIAGEIAGQAAEAKEED